VTLQPYEYQQLQNLLARQQIGLLTPMELIQLRTLLAKQNPAASTMTTEDLVKLGLFLVGLYALFKVLSK